jgi:riboflavin kinase/FMN adenylyltransferase
LGVYEIECDLNNDVYKGIVNIGYAPTVVDRNVLKVEAHLFNFDQDIYGEEIKIRLQRFIRPEKKFQSIDDLLEQIKADIDSIKNK